MIFEYKLSLHYCLFRAIRMWVVLCIRALFTRYLNRFLSCRKMRLNRLKHNEWEGRFGKWLTVQFWEKQLWAATNIWHVLGLNFWFFKLNFCLVFWGKGPWQNLFEFHSSFLTSDVYFYNNIVLVHKENFIHDHD